VDYLIEPELAQSAGAGLIAVVRDDVLERVTAPHCHARGQLISSIRGVMTIETPAGRWVVPAFDAAWIPPHVPHGLKSHGPYAGWSVYIAEAQCGDLPGRPLCLATSGLLREAIVRAASWTPQPRRDAARDRLSGVILDEIRSGQEKPFGLQSPRDARLVRITQAILSNPADNRNLRQWAAFGGLSTRTLTRQFRVETGLGLAEWRQTARLLRALEKLGAGESVAAIAFDLGYDTSSAFIAMFRRTFGATPGKFAADNAGAKPSA
jgi:AraC-like DNA-binding protein